MNANALTWTWLGATLCFAVLALAPMAAQAHHQTGWQAGGDGVPESVDLNGVAADASSAAIVAVGETSTGEAAIYRRPAGAWHADSIEGLEGEARLEAVALASGAAWAVGTIGSGEDEEPLVARLTGAALTSGSAESWESIDASALTRLPSSVALSGGSGLIGTAGTDGGGIHAISNASTSDPAPIIGESLRSGLRAVNGVAMHSSSVGYAVTDATGSSSDRIYRVEIGALTPVTAVFNTSSTNNDVIAVSAASTTQAVAVEAATAIWQPGTPSSLWTRSTPGEFNVPGTTLSAVSHIGPASQSVSAVAGDIAGAGAVWRRSEGAWVRHEGLSEAPLTGVAVLGEEDIWAVGGEGAVLHFAPVPHVPTAKILDGPTGTIADPTPTFKFEADDDENATFECQLTGGTWFGCESPYTTSPLADGTHTFEVRAINAHGTGNAAKRTFTVKRPSDAPPSQDDGNNGSTPQDGSGGGSPQGGGGGGSTQDPPPPPPPPSAWFVSGPTGTIAGPTATFAFTTDQQGVSFECRRNGEVWFACDSPHTTRQLTRGEHVFDVRATNANGTGPLASRAFTVVPRSGDRSGDGQARNCPRAAAGQRLLHGIRVNPRLRGKRKRVVVRFRARARARVRVIARRQGKIVGRTKMRTVKKGQRQMRVRVRQKPNRVRVIARLPKNCPQNRARAAGASR